MTTIVFLIETELFIRHIFSYDKIDTSLGFQNVTTREFQAYFIDSLIMKRSTRNIRHKARECIALSISSRVNINMKRIRLSTVRNMKKMATKLLLFIMEGFVLIIDLQRTKFHVLEIGDDPGDGEHV
jgi:uncharacterized protein YehS (DUF1456 family)